MTNTDYSNSYMKDDPQTYWTIAVLLLSVAALFAMVGYNVYERSKLEARIEKLEQISTQPESSQ